MRKLALGAALALAGAALVPVTSSAAPTTCQGQPVTIVAGPGDRTVGTDGDDVIVVDRARRVDARAGDDRICVTRLRGRQWLDLYAGAGIDRVRVQAKNERARLYTYLGPGDEYHGGPAGERVYGAGIVRASLGGGDDVLYATEHKYLPDDTPAQASPYSGGRGRDLIAVGVAQDDLDMDERITGDLKRGTVVAENAGEADDVVRFRTFEDIVLWGDVVTARGDGGRNAVRGIGCTVRLVGRAGADVLAQPDRFENYNGCRSGITMRGGPGPDRLLGRGGPDRLFGGVGRDIAKGNGGRDLCRTEVRVRCERR